MQRRNFIKLTASANALIMLPSQVMSMFNTFDMASCPVSTNKKLVIIQLQGANDGLNTVVPINQYDLYSSLRPTIKLNLTGNNKVITLDSTLPLDAQVGLHPALTGFKSLYDAGLMRIVQGVGYPAQDKSHFKSTDLWLTGGDGTPENNAISSGWMGRFLERYYADFLSASYPLGLQFGSSDNSLGFHGAEHTGLSMNLNNQDLNGYYSIINGLGGEPPANIPTSDFGDLLQFIIQNDASTNVYANSISNAFSAGTNAATYPNTFLANQLKTVGKLISGGLNTKVYLVKISGFDTHSGQVVQNETHLGTHASLLQQLSEAILAFVTDMNNQSLGDDVMGLTFSEFGRKIAQNGSLGTDHGEVAPMFLFGSVVRPGISGTNINLSEATQANNYQVKTVQFDYRRVFSTIMQDWLGASNSTLNYTLFDQTQNTGFGNQKLPQILKPVHVVPDNCYGDSVVTGSKDLVKNEVSIFPNHASDQINIVGLDNITKVKMMDAEGRVVRTWTENLRSDKLQLQLGTMADGMYVVNIQTATRSYSRKIFVKKQ
ncbi:MAG TPA: DUF1501 domain-containing protein [Catalimonadaceae bacterium]|nr:DUF1501 domain-containing protein [Catalimonadaceae bacterium]